MDFAVYDFRPAWNKKNARASSRREKSVWGLKMKVTVKLP